MKKHDEYCEGHQTLLELLGHLSLTRRLLHLLWVPPIPKCLIAAVERVYQLMLDYPAAFQDMHGAPDVSELQDWIIEARSELSARLSTHKKRTRKSNLGTDKERVDDEKSEAAFIEKISLSPIEGLRRPGGKLSEHPLYGYCLNDFSTYSLIIATREEHDPFAKGFDQLTSIVLRMAFDAHIKASESQYLNYCIEWEHENELVPPKPSSGSSQSTGPIIKSYPEVPINEMSRLREACKGIRTLQHLNNIDGCLFEGLELAMDSESAQVVLERARKTLVEIENDSQTKANHHIGGLLRFMREQPIRAVRRVASFEIDGDTTANPKTSKNSPLNGDDTEQLIETGPESSNNHLLGKNTAGQEPSPKQWIGTHLRTAKLDVQFNSESLNEESFDLVNEPSEEELAEAKDNDFDIREVIEPPIIQVDMLDHDEQSDDDETLEAWSRNKAELRRRNAEQLPFQLDYIHADGRITALDYLTAQANTSDQIDNWIAKRAAAGVALCGVATGRTIISLSNKLMIKAGITNADLSEASSDKSVIFDPSVFGLYVRVNQASIKRTDFNGTRKVSTWLLLPDYLQLAVPMAALVHPKLDSEALKKEIDTLKSHLRNALETPFSKLQKMLPLVLHSLTGEFSSSTLITDWMPENADVSLHYLSPRASVVLSHYADAMSEVMGKTILGEVLIEPNTPQQSGFIGIPTCPTNEAVLALIHGLSAYQIDPSDSHKVHNQICLNTILMLSFAIGTRHAIDLAPNAMELLHDDLAHFHEKGGTRLLVLPPLLGQQLRAYDRHRNVLTRAAKNKTASHLSKNLFFIYVGGKATEFHPSQLNDYLAEFDLKFGCSLNSLRRFLFTTLYEEKVWGVALDHYIGHATEGRRPFTPRSGMKLATLRGIAKHVNHLLIEMKWEVQQGLTA